MIPQLTDEQRRANLEKAKKARAERSEILRNVSNGSLSIRDVLDMAQQNDTIARMKVFTLIKAVPGYGFAKTQQAMKRMRISECKRIKGLGSRQREQLLELFGGVE